MTEHDEDSTRDDVTVMEDQTGDNELETGGVDEHADLDFRERAKLLPDHDTWLERPSTVRGLIIGSLIVLAISVIVEPIFIPDADYEAHFPGLDDWPTRYGWHAAFGLGSCVAMVVFSKWVIGAVLKRDDTYYTDGAAHTQTPAEGPDAAKHGGEA